MDVRHGILSSLIVAGVGLALSACSGGGGGGGGGASTSKSATLLSAAFTAKSEAKFQIACGSYGYYAVVSTANDTDPTYGVTTTWTACPTAGGTFEATSTLTSGIQYLHVMVGSGDSSAAMTSGERLLVSKIRSAPTGVLIQNPDPHTTDRFGSNIMELSNGNIVVYHQNDDITGQADVGRVDLIDGSTLEILGTWQGAATGDKLGEKVFDLKNGNFLVQGSFEYDGAFVNSGRVMLINGSDGTVIKTIDGSHTNAKLGETGVVVFSTGNFAIGAYAETVNSLASAGRIQYISGSTGDTLATVVGDSASDQCGYAANTGNFAVELSTGNIALSCPNDEGGGTNQVGVIRVFSATGTAVATLANPTSRANDRMGNTGLVALTNGGLAAINKDAGATGISNAGSVIVWDGSGNFVADLRGLMASDEFGSGGVFALPSGAFLVATGAADAGGTNDVGRVSRYDAAGTLVDSIEGAAASDSIGTYAKKLASGSFLVGYYNADNGKGVYMHLNSSGAEVTRFTGSGANLMLGDRQLFFTNGDYVLTEDFDGSDNAACMVRSGTDGSLKSSFSVSGVTSTSYGLKVYNNDLIVLAQWGETHNSLAAAGVITLRSSDGTVLGTIAGDVANGYLGATSNVSSDGKMLLASDNGTGAGSRLHIYSLETRERTRTFVGVTGSSSNFPSNGTAFSTAGLSKIIAPDNGMTVNSVANAGALLFYPLD